MTGVLTERINYADPIRLEDYMSSFGDVMGAHAEQALHFNPTAGILRGADRSEGYASAYEQALRESPDYDPGPTLPGVQPFAPEKVLTPEEATKKYGVPGALTFDSNIPESAAQQIQDLKRAELERQNVLRRAEGGVAETLAGFGVEFLMSAVDPINVASAFIPVVGEARYAMWAERFGRPLARTARGITEGVVGAVAVEPIVLAAAAAEHADYTAADSMLNIAFGGLLGGGLHLGGGYIKDKLLGTATDLAPHIQTVADAPQPVREAALRGAIAAMAEDRPIHVGDLFGAYTKTLDQQVSSIEGRIERLQQNNLGGRFTKEIEAARLELAPYQQLKQTQATLRALEQNNLGGRFNQQIAELRQSADLMTENLVVRPDEVRNEVQARQALAEAKVLEATHKAELDRILREERPEGGVRVREAKGKGDLGEISARIGRREIRERMGTAERNVAAARAAARAAEFEPLGSTGLDPKELMRRVVGDTDRMAPDDAEASAAATTLVAERVGTTAAAATDKEVQLLEQWAADLEKEVQAAVEGKQLSEATLKALEEDMAESLKASRQRAQGFKALSACVIGR